MPPEARPTAQPGPAAPVARAKPAALVLAPALAISLLLTACAQQPPAAPPSPVVTVPSPPPALPPAPAAPVATPAPAPVPPPPQAPAVSPLDTLLAATDRQRNLGPAELAAELARVGEAPTTPQQQMQLALLLVQTHQSADTARALGLLQRVAGSDSPEAAGLRPLARLLIARVQDLRRLEEQQERQSQQLRDAQRRIELLSERLEAMRAIERSLGPRPPAGGNARPMP